MKFSKSLLVSGVLVGALVLSGCMGSKKSGIALESVLPIEDPVVLSVNYSGEAKSDFRAVARKFPDFPGLEDELDNFNLFIEDEERNRKLQRVIKDDWKVVFGMDGQSVAEALEGAVSFDDDLPEMTDVFLVGQFDKADLLVELFLEENSENIEMTEQEGVKIYTGISEDGYLLSYMDLLVLTPSEKVKDAALAKLISPDEDFVERNELFYFSADFGDFSEVIATAYDQVLGANNFMSRLLTGFGEINFAANVDDEGFVFDVDLAVNDEESVLVSEADYRLALLNKVPVDGQLVAYLESPGADINLREIWSSYTTGYNSVTLGAPAPLYDDALAQFEESFGLNEQDVQGLIQSPAAVVVSTRGGYVPSFGFYFQLEEGNVASGEKLIALMDTYVTAGYSQAVQATSILWGPDVVRKGKANVGGGEVHKVVLDFGDNKEVFAEEMRRTAPDFESSDLDVALYYGITEDNVMFAAFQSNDDDLYGSNSVAESAEYLAAVDSLGVDQDVVYQVGYFGIGSVVDFASKFIEIGIEQSGFVPEEEAEIARGVVDFFATFDYFASVDWYEDGLLKSKARLRVE